MAADVRRFVAPQAWIHGAWQREVLLETDGQGCWSSITPGAPAAQCEGAQRLPGPVLPGLTNAHSHAFQRAIAGLTERSPGGQDDFWSWRSRMYAAALRLSPGQLEAIAAFLYAEMLRAGYTQVCEFHYLHNAIDGRPYAAPAEMALALARAARRVGIGLTLLPTLYMRAGFHAAGLQEDQRRFASTPEFILRIVEDVKATGRAQASPGLLRLGVALHSLRAVDLPALRALAQGAGARPIHIHIAEQQREVQDCQLAHGARPIEWLLAHHPLDSRWNLVHATQATQEELTALRHTGAAIVLCPSTEANLGDGIFDLPAWLGQSGPWSVGSDSHVTRSWTEELRLLEYSQRLHLRQRNVAARAALGESTAGILFDGALGGGSQAAGLALGGLAIGQRADFMVIDGDADALQGLPDKFLLDALVFSSPDAGMSQVFVAGQEKLSQLEPQRLRADLRSAMASLWE